MRNRDRIRVLMLDGQWRTAQEISFQVAKFYPPEKGMRRLDDKRIRHYKSNHGCDVEPGERLVARDMAELAYLGQDELAKTDVYCLKKEGDLLMEERGEVHYYKISPKGIRLAQKAQEREQRKHAKKVVK